MSKINRIIEKVRCPSHLTFSIIREFDISHIKSRTCLFAGA